MTIKRELGEQVAFIRGRDYVAPRVRIVPNTHKDAKDDEKALYISQNGTGISLSIETLESVLRWAKGE